jgi:hypothetical protein
MSVQKHPETIRNEALPDEVKPAITTQPRVDSSLLKSNEDNEKVQTQVKRLVKLKHLSVDERKAIIAELKAGLPNPYYQLAGNDSLRYIDKSSAKRGSRKYRVFEQKSRKINDSQRQALHGGGRGQEGVPEDTQIQTPAASLDQCIAVQNEARPPEYIPRGKIDLRNIQSLARMTQRADDGVLDPEFFNGVYGGPKR